MKTILHDSNQYVLRFDKGDEIISLLKEFCRQERTISAFFHGLGACSYLKLAYYNLKTKKYEETEYQQDLEIANITGNISTYENDLILHMHGTFADETMKCIAGHVVSVKTGGTCEILLTKFDYLMTRKLDEDTGLKLLD